MDKGKGKGAFQEAWNSNNTGFAYQGVCWNCGKLGHKSRECKEPKGGGKGIQELTGGEGEVTEGQAGSLERNVKAIERLPQSIPLCMVEVTNKYEALKEEEDAVRRS